MSRFEHPALRAPHRLALALVLVLVTIIALAHPSTAQARAAYSCGNSTSGHCYAYAETDLTSYSGQGATTKIYMAHLQCSQCGGGNTTTGFVDNEMWLFASTYNWVEAGYATESNIFSTWQDYFWADLRPQDCSGCINEHDVGGVPSGDYGQNPNFSIVRTGPNIFHVRIHSPNFLMDADSTDNTMDVDRVDMGQELAGNAGASAPNARFSYRYVIKPSGNTVGIYYDYVRLRREGGWSPVHWLRIGR